MSLPDAPHFEGRDIVCFANDWSGDPLSKKHVMRRLARHNRVLWVNSLGNRAPRATARDLSRVFEKLRRFAGGLTQVEPNIHVISPLAVPIYRSAIVRRVNQWIVGATVRAAMARLGFKRPIVYTFVPASAWVARELGAEQVIYHCVDEYSAFDGAGPEIARLEAELIEKSDLVITCSEPLEREKSALHPRTVLIRHGVEYGHFSRALEEAVPDEIARLPKPVLGFFGLLAEWVDLSLLADIAEAFPHGSLVLVGEINNANVAGLARLTALPNVHLLGRRPYQDLPSYCHGFDVALLPFVKNDLTEKASPLKLREYLAAGLPVVATRIPEAESLVHYGVKVADDSAGFITAIRQWIGEGAGLSRARSEGMAGESWDAKVAEIERNLLSL